MGGGGAEGEGGRMRIEVDLIESDVVCFRFCKTDRLCAALGNGESVGVGAD